MKDFTYDAENHKGYYKGKQIPSITQLISLLYPMDENIPEERLEKASEKGKKIHNDIELYNKGILDKCETTEGHYYELIMKKFGFSVYNTEKQVFIYDRKDDIIAFGTLDIILEKDSDLSVVDIKTICQFSNEKVALQCNMYKLAYEQCTTEKISSLFGIWVRDNEKEHICQLRPLKMLDNTDIYGIVAKLVKEWHEKNETRS